MVGVAGTSDYYSVGLIDEDGEAIVVVQGEIDLHAAGPLWACIEAALAVKPRLCLDMGETTFIDSSGIEVLARAYAAVGRMPEALVLRSASPAVRRLISLAGLDGCFVFTTDCSGPAEDSD